MTSTGPALTSEAPGQRPRPDMPAFGLPWYAHRMPRDLAARPLSVAIGEQRFTIGSDELATLPRTGQTSDFHCVTMWSRAAVRWEGVAFTEVYRALIEPRLGPGDAERTVVRFRGADGYRDRLDLEDLLRPDVLLADTMDGAPLSRANGAPLRLVAPAHYGYKNVKYLVGLDLVEPSRGPLVTLHHPRARVALEERLPYRLPQRAVGVVYRVSLRRATRWWFGVQERRKAS